MALAFNAIMELALYCLLSVHATVHDTVADKKKFPFPLCATPFRFRSVGVSFPFPFRC